MTPRKELRMSKIRRSFMNAVLSVVVMALAGFFLAAPSTAAPTTAVSASALAANPKPCGIKHYPPCPPKHVVHVYHKHPHRGEHVGVVAKHFPPHKIIRVHIVGHGRFQSLGRFVTNSHGNAVFQVKIPKHFPPGRYHLQIKIGSTIKNVVIHVKR
jgi:hypothetical protein